ncbi:hypothetical protein BCON_0136g00070 [Botryotinia convoluta]|uniref:Uncharacterized protein n=1 Tax=Botryotinia convoluta TaxID=54673 RepID=A0A4Z1HU99_9HELO|nr:hypothetical protein BCON_0136g00070 [Botryotinia convoluta]
MADESGNGVVKSLYLNVNLLSSYHNQAIHGLNCGADVSNGRAAVHNERTVNKEALLNVQLLLVTGSA